MVTEPVLVAVYEKIQARPVQIPENTKESKLDRSKVERIGVIR